MAHGDGATVASYDLQAPGTHAERAAATAPAQCEVTEDQRDVPDEEQGFLRFVADVARLFIGAENCPGHTGQDEGAREQYGVVGHGGQAPQWVDEGGCRGVVHVGLGRFTLWASDIVAR